MGGVGSFKESKGVETHRSFKESKGVETHWSFKEVSLVMAAGKLHCAHVCPACLPSHIPSLPCHRARESRLTGPSKKSFKESKGVETHRSFKEVSLVMAAGKLHCAHVCPACLPSHIPSLPCHRARESRLTGPSKKSFKESKGVETHWSFKEVSLVMAAGKLHCAHVCPACLPSHIPSLPCHRARESRLTGPSKKSFKEVSLVMAAGKLHCAHVCPACLPSHIPSLPCHRARESRLTGPSKKSFKESKGVETHRSFKEVSLVMAAGKLHCAHVCPACLPSHIPSLPCHRARESRLTGPSKK
ncbi:unnamed protein product [Closterium sp. NIES-64]|nr:unnamed protein product [Closterium sp. NIES-64]